MDYAYMMIIGLLMVAIAAAVIIIAKLGKLQKDTQTPLTQTDLLHMSEHIANNTAGQITGISDQVFKLNEQINQTMTSQIQSLNNQVSLMSTANEERIERLRVAVNDELRQIREDNAKSMEAMRQTVDEKLQTTLERRLGESFQQVGNRLEQVYKGLGEMQNLAAGVGDLQKLLRNVKIRGTWGEVQLGAILEQILTVEQYAANIKVNPNSNEIVEYAVCLPQGDDNPSVWLPIDAKCPLEDYQRLVECEEAGDAAGAASANRALGQKIKKEAEDIAKKYIVPPYTTDFAILFLPIEGLYAQVLQNAELLDVVQQQYRVLIAGPTTLAALLNSFQLGFRTLAIEKRAGEVWQLLAVVKQEFKSFGEALAKSQKKIQEASNALDATGVRTRAMARKLKSVESLNGMDKILTEEDLLDE
ncbi:MAG: DNA recombination protein RmuC [Clostridia bacterium]|nr:DNA recombination protein RmuC [Clostridia bacterium]